VLVIQRFSALLKKIKTLLLTKEGWIAWFLANVVVSAFWYVPFGIGLLFGIDWLYQLGITVFVTMWMPPPIESVFVAFLTIFFYNILKRNKK
jgi:hypothetical protein